jgi:hypothetical protein
MRITSGGNVGIGTSNAVYRTHLKCNFSDISKGLHLDASDTTDANRYALTIYPYVIESAKVGWKFRTQNVGVTSTPLTLNTSGEVVIESRVGIGTTPDTPFHSYHETDNILRLQTGTGGTTSIQFTKGTTTDALTDYRLISDTNVFKLQYSNDTLAYGGTGSDLLNISTTQTTISKKTQIDDNVGIGTTPHAT